MTRVFVDDIEVKKNLRTLRFYWILAAAVLVCSIGMHIVCLAGFAEKSFGNGWMSGFSLGVFLALMGYVGFYYERYQKSKRDYNAALKAAKENGDVYTP